MCQSSFPVDSALVKLLLLNIPLVSSIGVTSAADAARASEKTVAAQIIGSAHLSGGLIAHIGCGDGSLTAALRLNDRFLVHGLDRNRANIAAARERIRTLVLYGPVSVEQWTTRRLTYVDNSVNLVVVGESGLIDKSEIARVLVHGCTVVALCPQLPMSDALQKASLDGIAVCI